MAAPRTAEQFFADTTRQAVRQTESVQKALRRYVDESGNVVRTYWMGLSEVQQSGIRTVFALQNATMDANRSWYEAMAQSGRVMMDQWTTAMRQVQDSTASMMAAMITAGSSVIENANPPQRD